MHIYFAYSNERKEILRGQMKYFITLSFRIILKGEGGGGERRFSGRSRFLIFKIGRCKIEIDRGWGAGGRVEHIFRRLLINSDMAFM